MTNQHNKQFLEDTHLAAFPSYGPGNNSIGNPPVCRSPHLIASVGCIFADKIGDKSTLGLERSNPRKLEPIYSPASSESSSDLKNGHSDLKDGPSGIKDGPSDLKVGPSNLERN